VLFTSFRFIITHILMFSLYFHIRQDLKYDLYGLVEHSGSPNFGHYVCTIRSSPSSWHLMNDSLVSVSSHLLFIFMTNIFIF
jgi:ubiquitin C-terminal hydrolase